MVLAFKKYYNIERMFGMIKAGIMGATGYAGQQLAWLLLNHPEVEISFLSTNSYEDEAFSSIYKNYYGVADYTCVSTKTAFEMLGDIDVLFCSLPHGKSMDAVKAAYDKGIKVIDLSADYRIGSKDTYSEWYELEHSYPFLLEKAVYGLPELHRDSIKNARIIANPGCYPTSVILALAPLLKNGLIDKSSIIADSKSGVSGAGRSADISNIYTEVNESIKAYKLGSHRHTPEIEQELSKLGGENIVISFTPHLIPMNRGILSTCYATLNGSHEKSDIMKLYKDFYKDEFFVKVIDGVPETRWVKSSNFCHIGFSVDKRTGRIVVVSAIDNLMKGAASQAVQNMNIIFGIDEKTGINFAPTFP
ncbi:N-acetyl-gamma-glutamyl-phosphate reductase ArgC [Peptoclostridium acidaminophilum DSM 3953]|uniref:N-acetyl-gamma-glutamyl-phosphate reductase n=2 Tax=Peptoclostridium acidaminophilum TaxID=1731 RepID=W8U6F4_PEPAC|nr:N-acetyl-gamma-glutamyl-phosphate reductase ArgC [Peptoclostridium acidaminophilum DSM 3953]